MEQEEETGLEQLISGENYGWKILGLGGTNYSGTKIGPKWKPGFTKAIKYWVPSIAVSAMAIYMRRDLCRVEWRCINYIIKRSVFKKIKV